MEDEKVKDKSFCKKINEPYKQEESNDSKDKKVKTAPPKKKDQKKKPMPWNDHRYYQSCL